MYGVEVEGLFYHIQSQADTTFSPKYDRFEDMTKTLQHLHRSDLLTHDDDDGPNDIEYLRMLPGQTNEDFTIRGATELQHRICDLQTEYFKL